MCTGVLTYSTTSSIVVVLVTVCPRAIYFDICSSFLLFTILAAGSMAVISAKHSVDKSEPLLTPAATASVISSGVIPAKVAMVNSIFLQVLLVDIKLCLLQGCAQSHNLIKYCNSYEC